jgi:hypothetical protein
MMSFSVFNVSTAQSHLADKILFSSMLNFTAIKVFHSNELNFSRTILEKHHP